MTDRLREIIRDMMPSIPLPEQEELLNQVAECIYRFGLMRACTIGEVARRYFKEAVEHESAS